jgi:hypothetical protein
MDQRPKAFAVDAAAACVRKSASAILFTSVTGTQIMELFTVKTKPQTIRAEIQSSSRVPMIAPMQQTRGQSE